MHNVLLAWLSIMQSDNHTWKIQSEITEKELKASKSRSQELTVKVKELNVSSAMYTMWDLMYTPCEI